MKATKHKLGLAFVVGYPGVDRAVQVGLALAVAHEDDATGEEGEVAGAQGLPGREGGPAGSARPAPAPAPAAAASRAEARVEGHGGEACAPAVQVDSGGWGVGGRPGREREGDPGEEQGLQSSRPVFEPATQTEASGVMDGRRWVATRRSHRPGGRGLCMLGRSLNARFSSSKVTDEGAPSLAPAGEGGAISRSWRRLTDAQIPPKG